MSETAPAPTSTDSAPLVLPGLGEIRRRAALRRSGAFCPGLDYVLGIPCRPITPATFSMLHATGSRFIHGGEPMEGCIRNYLWFHSPQFVPADHPRHAANRRRALAQFTRSLLGPRWFRPFVRRFQPHRYSVVLALAANDIAAHIEESFCDAPGGSGAPGKPIAGLQAQMVDLMAREYGWTPAQASETPLRQIFQLVRCIIAHNGGDLDDSSENALLVAHLRAKNAGKLKE